MTINILVHEWVTGGGLAGEDCPPSWAAEGGAIRRALAADFQGVGGVKVVATVDERFREGRTPWGEVGVPDGGGLPAVLERLARGCHYTLVVAPETGGVLAGLTGLFDGTGTTLLGSSAEAVRLTSDKLRLADHLRAAGVATPPSAPVRPAEGLPARHPYPAVLKPVDGAGALQTFRVDRPETWRAPGGLPEMMLLQPYVHGESLSASFLVDGRGFARLIAVGRQSIRERPGGSFAYEGGRLPLPPAWALGAPFEAVRAVDGLRGFVGVDFVRESDTGATTVLEVNPRPTTSFVGLAAALGPGVVASAWLEAVQKGWAADDLGGMLRPGRDRPLAFTADGTVVEP